MIKDIYQKVTDQIYAQLQAGTAPWFKPWSAKHLEGSINRPIRATAEPYKGINVLLLWSASLERGFQSPQWLTFKQAQADGAHVRKGETGTMVVYADRMKKTEAGDDGAEVEREIPFLKAYTVFNTEQVEGLSAKFQRAASPPPQEAERIEAAEMFFQNTGAKINHGGAKAFYAPGPDFIQMPPREAFNAPDAYYSTLAHEGIHWTGNGTRLDRTLTGRFGTVAYAGEEIIAELGASYICADLGIEAEPKPDHASYLSNWLQAMKEDNRFIFKASSMASKAADYLHSLQPKPPAP